MDPLATIDAAAVILQFIQYAGKACHFVNTLRDDNYDDFYEGIFVVMARHFFNFLTYFKTQRQVRFTPSSFLIQEVGRL